MPRKSALEDFWQRALESSEDVWERLLYVSRLRGNDGTYHHWGLERTYGSDQAQRAMQAIHERLFMQLLRTPLRTLAAPSTAAAPPDPPESSTTLVPDSCEGGSVHHFWSIYDAITTIRARRTKTSG